MTDVKLENRKNRKLTQEKALQVNLNSSIYGAIVEIGAGQETARQFFNAGAAAGTVAKTMSAYDMQVSDDVYGKAGRYVSRERCEQMLDHEYGLMVQRLDDARGDENSFFFAYAANGKPRAAIVKKTSVMAGSV